jgi:anti-sigma B factor antagonist
MATAAGLRRVLYRAVGVAGRLVVIDMTDVEFCDSTGVGVLLGGTKRSRASGGRMALAGLAPTVDRHFKVMGMQRVFPIFATVAEAVEWVDAVGLPDSMPCSGRRSRSSYVTTAQSVVPAGNPSG